MRPSASVSIASLAIALALGGCFYDFSAPFANSDAAGGAGGADTSASTEAAGATSSTSSSSKTSSTSGTASKSSVTASSSSTMPPSEDCTNGIDDDGDGKIDCADGDCASGYACVAGVADASFNGPYFVAIAGAGKAPSCPSRTTSVLSAHAGAITAPDAACSTCSCDTSPAPTCGAPSMVLGVSCTVAETLATTCTTFFAISTNASVTQKVTSSGGCSPSGGVATPPAIDFAEDATVCSIDATGGGCSAGEACVALAPAGFEVCYEAPGDVACPIKLPSKTTIYEGVDDTRDCTPCGCTAGAVSCNDTTTFFGTTGCAGTMTNVAEDAGCVPAGVAASWLYTPGTPTLACAASGGTPTGAVTPAMTHTICCAM